MRSQPHHLLPPGTPTRSERDGGSVSVVLPAYNEARALADLIPEVSQALQGLGVAFEVVVVDDGSTDGTPALMRSLCQRMSCIRYLRLARNFGKEAALTAGLEYALGDAVILMDADGQHPIELLEEFMRHWREGASSVVGVQVQRDESWLQRRLKSWYYKIMNSASSLELRSGAGDFRLLDRQVVNQLNRLSERNRFMKGLYAWVGFDTVWIDYQARPRAHGRSRFGWKGLLRLGLTGLTAFSVVPLRMVSALGLGVSIAAMVYGLYLCVEHFTGHHLPGWATITVGMMVLSGVQLLSLGVIAEYVGRIFNEVKQRPVFVVAEHLAAADSRSERFAASAGTTAELLLHRARR